MPNTDNNSKLFIIVLIFFLLYAGLNDGSDTSTSSDDSSGIDVPTCNLEDISFTPKMTRLGKIGTSLSTSSYNYYILTEGLGSVAANSNINLPTEKNIKVMFAESATDYYTIADEVNTDCVDPFYHTVELPKVETSFASFYVKNEDGSVNSVSGTQAVGGSSVAEISAVMKSSSDEYFGNPNSDCSNIGLVEFDKTYISKVEGSDFAPIPGFFTNNGTAYDGANAFKIPKLGSNEEKSFNIRIETATDPDGTNNPTLRVYDCDFDKDEETLELIEGIQDESINKISLAQHNKTIYLS